MLLDPSSVFEDDMLRRLATALLDKPRVWQQCKGVLKQHRLVRDVEGRVKILAREMAEIPSIGGPPATERSIAEIWRGAADLVGDDVYVPDGYAIQEGSPAIERIESRMVGDSPYEKRIPVSPGPLLVTKRIGHVQEKTLLLEVAFRTATGWRTYVADRDVFFNARKIVDTSRMGLPVSSGNALELVEWIHAYENANATRIQQGYASGQMGWQGRPDNPTEHGFLCGIRQMGGNGRAIDLDGSDGQMRDAREIKEHGTFNAWNATIERLIQFPAVRIALCASLAAPLLAILEAPIPIYEWAGRTSTGKTSVLAIAQSVWRSGKKHMETWDSTNVSFEASATFNCDLPIYLDETSLAIRGTRNVDVAKAIYQLVSGRGKGRGDIKGRNRIRAEWRTVVLATGETPLGELAKMEGAAARVLTFWSAPLGETTPETAALITECLHDLGQNYGHAGPRLVRWLCENRDRWDELRTLYQATTKLVRTKICTPAASRLADIVALLEVAAYAAAAAGVLPWLRRSLFDEEDIVIALRNALTLATSSSDRAYDAWEYAIGEAMSRPKSWIPWGNEPDSERDPPGGWLGYRNAEEWAWIPNQLKKALVAGGFTPESVLRAWRDLGVLIQPERDRFTSQARPGKFREKQRLIRVRNEYPGHEFTEEG